MALASHRIGVLEVELRLQEEPQARPLMDRVSALREPRLEGVMQRVLDELSPAGRLDRFDVVDLDLGPLPLSGFDDAFLARLEQALRQALAVQLQGRPAEAPISPVLELLQLFARTGSLPWWADRADPRLISAQIRRALELDPETFWTLLRDLQASSTAIERLAAACDQPTLAALLGALLADGKGPIAGIQRVKPAPKNDSDDLETGVTSQAGRVRLLRLAAQGLRGEALRRALSQADLEVLPQSPALESPSPALPLATESVTAAWLRWLESAEASQKGMEGLGGGEMAALPPELLALLPEPLRSLAAQGLRGEALRRALAARRPGEAPSVPGPQQLAPPLTSSDSLRPAADPDELALDDGGLVILWPFLTTLLSRLEYLEPELKLFVSEQARNQAIALLSFLVEGDAEPPEWRLALAKVLCGLSPLVPWRLEEPLKPEALVEGERLLEAVIAHGGLAEKIEPQDLRGLILRRPAVLTSRTGAWLLRVERRPEDGLLDRFPWGWSWIRLPWMDHPLQVEW